MIIRTRAYPRGGLVGNPSDGYFGKTLALAFTNFHADVTLYESPELEILPSARDHSVFESVAHLAADVRCYGYYGGVRLLKAAVKRFHDYCVGEGIVLPPRNFTIRYTSDIPHLVGLAGSSAIICACFRALKTFYNVAIPRPVEANLILSVEVDELGIAAGLQDRVAQVYQGLVYMDFDRALMERRHYGRYREIDPELLPPIYIAYRADLAEGSEIVHNDFRARFKRGEPEVRDAVAFWAELTERTLGLLEAGRGAEIGELLNANYDRRARVMAISDGNRRLVEAARSTGASAKFTGSGGAIIGTFRDAAMYGDLVRTLEPLDVRVMKPCIAPGTGEEHA